jgi:NitT/TauT family transport system substrate-binding protein
MKRLVVLAGALVAFAVLPRPAVAADDQLTLIGGSFPTAFYEVLVDVAQAGGFFKEEHLDVNIQYAGNPAVAIQALAGGKGDIASGNINGILQGYARGVRMTAVFSRSPSFLDVTAVLDASPIRTLADFKGKTLGVRTVGQPTEVYTGQLLAGAGLKKGDYSFAPIGSGAQAIEALTTGKVDGAAFPYPELKTYENAAHIRFRYFFDPILKDIPDDGFIAAPATIAAKSDQLARFFRAIVKAAILVRVNPHLAARYFVQGSGMKVTADAVTTEAHLLAISEDLLPAHDLSNPRIGEFPVRGIAVLAKYMVDQGLTPNLIPARDLVDDRFIAFANAFDRRAFIARARAMK